MSHTTTHVEADRASIISLADTDFASFPSRERTVTIRCASGTRTTAGWEGIPVPALLDRAEVPPDTTHLLIESNDGYRACIDICDALEGVIAETRDGQRLDDGERPRLVVPEIDGARTVKDVATITPVSLAPGEDPTALEDLQLEA